MSKIFIDKKNIIILVLLIIILSLIIFISNFIYIRTNSSNINKSNYSYEQLLRMLEDDGYYVRIRDIDNCVYINLINDEIGIEIQRIPKTAIGPVMTFENKNINDEFADLISLSKNNTIEKELQYKNYKDLLKKYNITTKQITDLLEEYYNKNKNECEVTNTQELIDSISNLL